jgi:hypothetical protein
MSAPVALKKRRCMVAFLCRYDNQDILLSQTASAVRRESAVNLGIAEFPQDGFIPSEDVK